MAPVLGYWKSRGLGQQIRLLLHYCGEQFKQDFYEAGPGEIFYSGTYYVAPDFSREQWESKKNNLGLDFPNLPYLIDGNVKLTQSSAILEYIADKHGMLPKSASDRAMLHMVHQVGMDVRNAFYRLTFGPDYEINRVEYLKGLPNDLRRLSTFLGNKNFFSGEKVNYPDFNIYDLLIILKTYVPACLDEFENLRLYISRFENLKAIKAYMNSPEYLHRPFTNTMAHWGYYFD